MLPGGFDSQFHAYFDGIGAYANTTGAARDRGDRRGDGAPARVVDGVRGAIAARIDAALSQPAAGIARALITGDQSAVDDEAREVMAVAGLAHVLSVSGLHLTIVAGGVFAALRLLLSLSEGLARRVLGQAPRGVRRHRRRAALLRDLGRQRRGAARDGDDRPGLRRGASSAGGR